MDILIQNTGATPLFMTLTSSERGSKGSAGRITIDADNAITKISEELYEAKIKNNDFFKQRIDTGVLVILNDRQVSTAVESSISTSELNYARYKNLMFTVKAQGGVQNEELAQYLDRDGMPKLDLVRSNMGQVDPQKIAEYKARFIAEQGSNLSSLQLPSNKRMSVGSKDIDKELADIAATASKVAKADKSTEEDEIAEDDSEERIDDAPFTEEELSEMDKDELVEIATDLGLDFGARIGNANLIKKILDFQSGE